MAITYTNFCCRSGGSNLNAGTRTGDTTEPGTTADLTYASGSWNGTTGVFTPASGNPSTDGVAVGDFASIYPDAASVTPFIARVTARDTTTITVSLTAKAGTKPADGTTNTTLKIGGAWAGPSGTVGFPFSVPIQSTLRNTSDNVCRINFKNDATYSVTAAINHNSAGPIVWQGYSTSYGDGGRATINGGTSGTGYTLVTFVAAGQFVVDFIFSNNGASGNTAVCQSNNISSFYRCVFTGSRGVGFNGNGSAQFLQQCEAYGNNLSGNASIAGFFNYAFGSTLHSCIAHDNSTGTTSGFRGAAVHVNCIADTNSGDGFYDTGYGSYYQCDAYNNSGNGALCTVGNSIISFINCNFIKNGAYGIDLSGITGYSGGIILNCAFGAGTQANTSGTINYAGTLISQIESGTITYASDVTPWTDPANGDFRIRLAAAINVGYGTYTQTASSYAGTVAYPDIGAAQHKSIQSPTLILGV